eukprot:1048105-Pleurochrysis_carterae.AAC.1
MPRPHATARRRHQPGAAGRMAICMSMRVRRQAYAYTGVCVRRRICAVEECACAGVCGRAGVRARTRSHACASACVCEHVPAGAGVWAR